MPANVAPDSGAKTPVVDVHTHIFCWGENPSEGFISKKTRQAWLTRLLIRKMKLLQEPGEDLSSKMRNLLLRHVRGSSIDYAVVLAQDAVYREDGSRDDSRTHFFVSNDYVFGLAQECPKILPGASINPWRSDALQELDRCHRAGARLNQSPHGDPRRQSGSAALRSLLPPRRRIGPDADVPHRV